ncbi:SIR2 family protein [Vibrio cyclitrophicus]
MTQSKSETYLKEAMSEGKLIPLVGAGVSMAITDKNNNRIFPSWTELLEKAAEEIDVDERDLIEGFIKRGRLLEAAREARDSITGDLWFNFIRAQFDPKLDECNQNSFDLPKAIWKLSNQIITLNYDRVMNYASNASNTSIIKNSSPAQISKMQSPSNDKMVWHLHGHVDEPDNLVLTPKSYEVLYDDTSQYQAAIQALKNILSTRSLIFIGCSMNDIDLITKLDEQENLFSGNTKLHFVLVKENEKDIIKEKIKNLNTIKIITYSEHGQPLIDEIEKISELGKESSPIKKTNTNSLDSLTFDKIAYLRSNPFGSKVNFSSLEKVITRKLPFDLDTFSLSKTNLQDLENYNYILIACEIRQNKLVIENDWCGSQLLSIHKIKENLVLENLKGIIVVCDQLPDLSALESVEQSIVFIPELNRNKKLLKDLWFNLFKKQSFSYLENDCLLHNISKFDISPPLKCMSGKAKDSNIALPREISNDEVRNFIGRQQDLEDCSRKLLEAKENGEFLSIIGSGGVGKTSIAKKVAFEFNKRNYFDQGVTFIDCESLTNAQQFHRYMAGTFGLNDALDFISHLKNNSVLQQGERLIIIDNVESLLNIQDKDEVLDIISNTSDFATLLLTSRERTNLNLESTFLLRDFITDEAFQLFEKKSNQKFRDYEVEFLKKFILKDLLDNNPLAISLVAGSFISGKDVKVLKNELEENFFELTKNQKNYFDGNENENVDRKSSIYNSIDYSYRYLNKTQKEALIKLSYFPDGIDLESFKRTASSNSIKTNRVPIKDSTIKSLQDKSLIQNSNRYIKLHPLILRFSKDKIRKEDESLYIKSVFQYNYQFSSALIDMTFSSNLKKQLISRNLSYMHLKNFSLILELLDENIDQQEIVTFTYRISTLFAEVGAFRELYTSLSRSINRFNGTGNVELLLKVILTSTKYFLGDFDSSYKELKKLLPIDKWLELNEKDYITKSSLLMLKNKITNIEESEIDEILVVNPYTSGIKNLLKAIHCCDVDEAIILFNSALNDLRHIKFSYVSALLEYASHLKEIGYIQEFENISIEGIELSIKYKFDYLNYCFMQLKDNNSITNSYISPSTSLFEDYTIKCVEHCNLRVQ